MCIRRCAHLNNVQGLLNASLLVKREHSVDLCRHTAGNNLENLAAELHEQVVKSRVDLLIDVLAVLLAVSHRLVDELGVLGLLGGREDQGRVGGGILGLVFANGRKVARVADNGLAEEAGCQ